MSDAPQFADSAVPKLRNGFRFQYEPAQDTHVLLFPEGMIKLSGSAKEIIERCDGERSVANIVSSLETAFPGVDLRADVHEFLGEASNNGWLDVH